MKTSIKILILIVIAGFFADSCKKNIFVKDNPFETQLIFNENNFVLNEKNKFEINILPDHAVLTTKYKFSYKVLKGKGHFVNDKDSTINADDIYSLSGIKDNVYFVTDEVGQLSLQLDFQDNNGEEKQDIITVDAGYYSSDFTFTAIAVSDHALVDEGVPINFNLDGPTSNQEDKALVKYSLIFTSTGTGILNYKGTEYQEGQLINIVPGTFSGVYTGSDETSHEITFKVTNDNNKPVEKTAAATINYTYYQSEFTFTATTNQTDLFVNDTTYIDFDLTENLKDQVTYTLVYTTSENGIFNYGGTEYAAGENINIIPGTSSGVYVGTVDGTHNLQFSVTNSNVHPQTHTENISVNYTYYSSDFNIIGLPEETNVNVNDSVKINFTLTELLKTPDVNYTMNFTSNGAGTFTYNGVTYYATQTMQIQPGQFNGKYVGTDAQTHNIVFHVYNDNQNPVLHDVDVTIIFQNNDYDIGVTPLTGSTYPKERTQDYFLTINGGGDTETSLIIEDLGSASQSDPEINNVRTDFDGGFTQTTIIDGNGGQNKINFKTYAVGEYHYILHVTKNGIEKVQEIVLNSLKPTFTITDYHVAWANRYWDLDQSYSATVHTDYTQNIDYTFKVEDNGFLRVKTVNGNTNITSGYQNMPITVMTEGTQTTTVTVTNEYGYSKTKTTTYTILDPRPVCVLSGMHMYQPNFWHDHYILEGTITGTKKEGDYCNYCTIQYYDYYNHVWRFVTSGFLYLVNNKIDIQDTQYNHWDKPVVPGGGYLDKITKWRISVTDNEGRNSEYVEYIETAPKNNLKE